VPPVEATQAELARCEALIAADRRDEAQARLDACEATLDPRTSPAIWGEFLRLRGAVHERAGRLAHAHHDYAQSAAVFDLIGERYQTALSQVAVGRVAAVGGERDAAERLLSDAAAAFQALGAQSDLQAVAAMQAALPAPAGRPPVAVDDAVDALVTRLVDASVLPELLARETCSALVESLRARSAVVYVVERGEVRVVAASGAGSEQASSLARTSAAGASRFESRTLVTEPLGRVQTTVRACALLFEEPVSGEQTRRLRLLTAVARQGFQLCEARERPGAVTEQAVERAVEPLLPGFICASPPMHRLAEQIQRLQGHDLTVLITGESGTGKDLVARAIHSGSMRKAAGFLPFNCTTTTRELADSQLFGHRRGSFTGAVSDQQGLIRAAAGGTLFLDEIGDLPLDIQPKLLRFLEQGEIMPVGETRPLAVDVRVLAATNADLEQRVAEGRFREDLYYRLSVIRIQVPPLRERREEIPHLTTFFLREACERLGKSDVSLDPATLDLFAHYYWPGNVRQLRNEIQRAVALSPSGGLITPEQLSPDLTAPAVAARSGAAARALPRLASGTLAEAVDALERDLISSTLQRSGGNISEAARVLGLTRRGLYLKLKRLGLEAPMLDTP
jgi:DNA-binding NtrC family response regulator